MITPSIPSALPNGSRNAAQCAKRLISPIVILANSQMMIPAGAATTAARPNTKSVRSKIERTITFPIWGRRYGGSSKVKEEGIPFKMVADRRRETRNVMTTPSRITPVRISVEITDCRGSATTPTKNMLIMAMMVGNRPLQGTKLLVMMAINLSRGESMMRQPTTPAALHPNPIHMVRACLPHARAFWKCRSKLNATRGRYPKSSSSVNNGKKIAIGGSITETTQARTRYIPNTKTPCNQSGAPAH